MKTAAVILAEGLEEVEAVTPIDFLRRAGIAVITVSLGDLLVEGSHGLILKADVTLDDFPMDADAVVIPGGMPGSANIAGNQRVLDIIRSFDSEKKLVAAICAAPALALGAAGVLEGKKFTCYPGMESRAGSGGLHSDDRVVEDGNLITSRGAGTAAEFAAAIISRLESASAAGEVMKSTLQAGY